MIHTFFRKFSVILLCAALLSPSAFASETDTPPLLGKKAPVFETKTLDGKEFKLKDYEGKLVLVDFWATWCPPCKAELPHLKEVYAKYHKKGLEIVSISAEDSNIIKPFASANKMDWIHISDPQKKLLRLYNIESYPSPFLIGPDGTLLEKHIPLRIHYLEKSIEEHIDKVKPEALKKVDAAE